MYIRTKIGIFEKETPNKDNDFLVEDETKSNDDYRCDNYRCEHYLELERIEE